MRARHHLRGRLAISSLVAAIAGALALVAAIVIVIVGDEGSTERGIIIINGREILDTSEGCFELSPERDEYSDIVGRLFELRVRPCGAGDDSWVLVDTLWDWTPSAPAE